MFEYTLVIFHNFNYLVINEYARYLTQTHTHVHVHTQHIHVCAYTHTHTLPSAYSSEGDSYRKICKANFPKI